MNTKIQSAIIGHTGFVGSTLMRSMPGTEGFNSRNIDDARGSHFGTLYCAAAPGSMFEANRFPDRDACRIDKLIEALRTLRADRFVLVSTIAVLDRFDGGYTEENAQYQQTTPYGANRRTLERCCREIFPSCLIVRLPALFGTGLAKNFIFDLMNPMPTMLSAEAYEILATGLSEKLQPALQAVYSLNASLDMHVIDRAVLATLPERASLEAAAGELGVGAVMFHNRDTTYQFYEMVELASDIDRALEAGLDCIHLAPPPLRAADIHLALTGKEMQETGGRLHREDMRTQHAGLWGHEGSYIRSAEDTLRALTAFFQREKKR